MDYNKNKSKCKVSAHLYILWKKLNNTATLLTKHQVFLDFFNYATTKPVKYI